MTNRHGAYIVVLDDDIREDADQEIINALSMVRGVAGVQPITTTATTQIAEMRAKNRLNKKVVAFFNTLFEEN